MAVLLRGSVFVWWQFLNICNVARDKSAGFSHTRRLALHILPRANNARLHEKREQDPRRTHTRARMHALSLHFRSCCHCSTATIVSLTESLLARLEVEARDAFDSDLQRDPVAHNTHAREMHVQHHVKHMHGSQSHSHAPQSAVQSSFSPY